MIFKGYQHTSHSSRVKESRLTRKTFNHFTYLSCKCIYTGLLVCAQLASKKLFENTQHWDEIEENKLCATNFRLYIMELYKCKGDYSCKYRTVHECSCIIEFIKQVGEEIKCEALQSILSPFHKFNKFNEPGA